MRKYLVVVLAFFTFCSNDAAITDDYYVIDCSEIEKDISQTGRKNRRIRK